MSGAAPVRLTKAHARRIALAAQGFAEPRPAPGQATMRHLQRVIDRVGVVQIDSVNVLVRSHYLPFFSRLGPYDRSLLERARDRAPRRLVEYWAHEASLIPPQTWPLLDFRMQRALSDAWGGMQRVAGEHPELVGAVLDEVVQRGPLTSRQVEAALEHDLPRERDQWGWNWSLVKAALEHLFWSGQVSSAGRTTSFERRYAALGRVLPPPVAEVAVDPASRPPHDVAFRELIMMLREPTAWAPSSACATTSGCGPSRPAPRWSRSWPRGRCSPPRSRGGAARHTCTRRPAGPRRVHGQALLSPFDSLIWQRDRTAALFGFDYRLEIYVPFTYASWLLRAAVPLRGAPRGPLRPQGRPHRRGAPRPRRPLGARGPA